MVKFVKQCLGGSSGSENINTRTSATIKVIPSSVSGFNAEADFCTIADAWTWTHQQHYLICFYSIL